MSLLRASLRSSEDSRTNLDNIAIPSSTMRYGIFAEFFRLHPSLLDASRFAYLRFSTRKRMICSQYSMSAKTQEGY